MDINLHLSKRMVIIVCAVIFIATSVFVSRMVASIPKSTSVAEVIGLKETPAEELVAVDNPFDGGPGGASFSAKPSGNEIKLITSVKYDVTGSDPLMLPVDFSQMGSAISASETNKSLVIEKIYTFAQDNAVVWDTVSSPRPQDSWDVHPDRLEVKAGQSVRVIYESEDGGSTWKGSVKIL